MEDNRIPTLKKLITWDNIQEEAIGTSQDAGMTAEEIGMVILAIIEDRIKTGDITLIGVTILKGEQTTMPIAGAMMKTETPTEGEINNKFIILRTRKTRTGLLP